MVKLGLSGWLVALAAVCGALPAASQSTLQGLATDAPPMVMSTPVVAGFVAEVTDAALALAGYRAEWVFKPWKRNQVDAAEGHNLLITPLSRTAEREALYRWIAPIFTLERSFATLDHPIDSYEQALAERRLIGVGLGSAQTALLHGQGFPPEMIREVQIGQSEIELLTMGRIGAWFNGTLETQWRWQQSGAKARLILGKPVDSSVIYLACSRVCDEAIATGIGAAMARLERDGVIAARMQAYAVRPGW